MAGEMREQQRRIHAWATEKGWWEAPRNLGEICALIHSEVSEALEEYRVADDRSELVRVRVAEDGKPEGFFVELADAVIRIEDLCEAYGVDLWELIEQKMAYNATRPYRHGGKKA